VFRRATKWIELSAEIRDAFDHDDKDYVDGRITERRTTTADDIANLIEATPVVEPSPVAETPDEEYADA